MFSVEVDRSKRLVVISVAGSVTAADVKEAAKQVREMIGEMAPGFRALVDYRWLEKMETAAARYIAEIMDALANRGVSSVTRVVPDPRKDIGLNILSQFHYGPAIQVMTFESLADAVQGLADDIGAD
jgi:anti-anti-sigma regulatory factor